MNTRKLFYVINLALLGMFAFIGCATLQKDVYITEIKYSEDIMRFEERLVLLDGQAIANPKGLDKQKKAECTALIADIEKSLADVTLNNASKARLYAIEGCAYLLLDKSRKAKSLYSDSLKTFKGDARSVILGSRLELETGLESRLHEVSDPSLLKIEIALNNYRKNNFSEAVAVFDEAFIVIADFYRVAYKEVRDSAWELRSFAEGDVVSYEMNKELTVSQMVFMANQRSELLFKYTLGKTLSESALFKKILASGLLTSKTEESVQPKPKDTLTRFIAARFMWNLYNEKRNTAEKTTRYSVQYKKYNMTSPIEDVSLDNPDFDAVMGCVEKEFINLTDGKHFEGEKTLSGSEMAEILEKIR